MTPDHDVLLELLPFFVNGTLEKDERLQVEAHLESCESCRNEVDELEDLRLQVRWAGKSLQVQHGPGPEVGAIWARLGMRFSQPRRTAPNATLRWLLAGQAAAIIVLLTLLVGPERQNETSRVAESRSSSESEVFQTLSSPETPTESSARLRVVFREDVRELEMREFLVSNRLEIVVGPNQVGAYGLSWPRDSTDEDLQTLVVRLRGDPRLRMIEPLSEAASSPPLH